MLSNHQKGYYRDNKIIQAINEHGVLNTDQIQIMFFSSQRYGRRIAQRRLLKLTKLHRLKRSRDSLDQPHYYYINKHKQVTHRLGVNWIRIWLNKWESVSTFSYEPDYSILRSDAFVSVKTGDKHKFYFVEFDNNSWNEFDKVKKYNRLYENELRTWWVEHTHRFPAIIVVTTSRESLIRKKVKRDNTNGLEFKVYNLKDIKRSCM